MSGFWIDVYAADGTRESGTSFDISNVAFIDKCNRIGQVTFTVPVTALNDLQPAYAKRYRLYSELRGYRGEYRHKTMTIDADAKTATITADDTLINLANAMVGFNRFYGAGNTVKSIVDGLAAAAGWTVTYEPGFPDDPLTAEFQGESFLTALDTFRSYVRGWFTRDGDTALRFGQFRNLGRLYTFYQNSQASDAETFVTVDAVVGGTWIEVDDTGDFPTAGVITSGVVDVSYASKDATHFYLPAFHVLGPAEAAAYTVDVLVFQGTATIYGQRNYRSTLGSVDPAQIDALLMNQDVVSSSTPRGNQSVSNTGALQGSPPAFALITKLTQTVEGVAVVNRVYPFGAGVGVNRLDLRYSNFDSPYLRTAHTNPDGSESIYIEDVASQGLYGVIERQLQFNDIRPITNSAADLQAAANCIYVLATAYLRKFTFPFEVYSVACLNLPEAAKPGSIISVEFRGVATKEIAGAPAEEAWLYIPKAPFFILEKTTRYDEHGTPSYDLVISSNGEGNVSSTDIFVNTLRDIEKFKARPTPTQTYYTKANPTLPIVATAPQVAQIKQTFSFVVGPEVLLINDMVLEMRLSRLMTYQTVDVTVGASTTNLLPDAAKTTTSDPSNSYTAANNQDSSRHQHDIQVANGAVGFPMYFDPGSSRVYANGGSGQFYANPGQSAHVHAITNPAHYHTHQHQHGIPAGSITGTFKVALDPNFPLNVTVRVNGVVITNWTMTDDIQNGSTNGTNCNGEALFRANITAQIAAMAGNPSGAVGFIEFTCGTNQGLVFAQLLGRITIQPIAVST